MQIAAGVRIASFEVRAHIGAGGMGTVYRAYDTKLGRDVAIKILRENLAESADYLRRFEREARSASALNHPNIITIFEINEFEGAPFIAMELVEGTRVREMLLPGALPLRKLLNVATQIADGLAAAHERGIVHRDMKPENVMITRQGLVKILDFGLARLGGPADKYEDDSTAEITRERGGRLLGTASYMSPEQASGAEVDFRSDQFSFGAMLYEMATGRRAFKRDSTADTIHAIIHDEPEPIQRINPRIPAPLCWIIERCLAKDPNDRYASTTDLKRELQIFRERLPDTGSGDRLLHGFRIPPRKRALVIASAVAVVIVLAILVRLPDRLRPASAPVSGRQYLAVLPFKDLSGQRDNELFSRGLAEAVSSRLAKFSAIQVIPPTSSAPLIAKGADGRRIAQELGATMLLNASVQHNGDTLKIQYALTDSISGNTIAKDTVTGSVDSMWAVQDEVSDAIARRLGIEQSPPPSQQAELETAEEQDLYLRALGNLQNYEDEKSLDAALAQLRELLETASGSPLVHAALGRTYMYKYILTKDRPWSEKAIQAADRSRVLAPDAPDVLLTYANVQRLTGRFAEAIATFKRALVLQPNSPEAVLGLANSYQGAGQIEDAERAFRRAIALRPTWWAGHNDLGAMYLGLARYDDAAREFSQVTQLNPQSSWGYSNLGATHIMKERLPEAIAALTKAVSIREDAAAYGNLGYCYYYLGRYEKSAEAYRKAVTLRPNVATQWANLSDACRWTPTCASEVEPATDEAIKLLNQELAVNPRNSRAHATLAVCLAQSGRRDDAQEHIRQALELEPKNPTRMFQAARVANLRGDSSGAVSWLRRAIDAGSGELEIQRDPEFRELRRTDAFRIAFRKPGQAT
jgi:serine/threonine protein kinase/tetratricopeptide (TPR) repeat protein